ncbi:ribosomal RNA-processing protein 9 [Geosmithia morbida]|uniref:Ribosomal RNA-processing protein 9 n=1 Tax=Geosmithia morbida TaxID=1094350 RepID=A0A9P4YPR5_9HYPO|nr:ribosomal RNA-processing protein 9 [Geosmithia morbida]KAF4120480.1 ribosomal RNA-processing protein 9 [Geosmithia morbida]
MSSFFTVPGAQKKRKRLSGPDAPKKRVAPTNSSRSKLGKPSSSRGGPPLKKNSSSGTSSSKKAGGKAAKDDEDDESISGSDSDDLDDARQQDGSDDDNGESSSEDGRVTEGQDEEETAAERRLRLAERYLENIKEHVDEAGFDAADIDRDLIAERLQEDMAESKGRVYRQLASSLALDRASRTFFRSNSRAVTSISTCGPYVYTASKDMCLHKWRTQDLPQDQFPQTTRRKPAGPDAPARRRPTLETWVKGDRGKARDRGYKRHVGPILAVAASPDGQYVVTGGEDRRLIVWDAATLRPLKVLSQHRDAVTGLAFRRGTNQLYSCSRDRTVKVWSLDEMAYVETLFGHQDHVVDIDALAQERCVSVGARDRTARLWKVAEETQLVFRGGSTTAPKASAHPAVAAVADPRSLLGEGSMDRIAMIDDDLFVTGGDNGSLALWSVQKKKPVYIEPLAHGLDPALRPEQASADKNPKPDVVPAPTPRWVTAIRAIPYSDVFFTGSWDGYHRLGRWRTWKKARNGGVIFEVPRSRELSDDGSEHGDEDEDEGDDDEEEEEE